MDDDKSLCDYGLTSSVAKAQQPAEVGLAFRSAQPVDTILYISLVCCRFAFKEALPVDTTL